MPNSRMKCGRCWTGATAPTWRVGARADLCDDRRRAPRRFCFARQRRRPPRRILAERDQVEHGALLDRLDRELQDAYDPSHPAREPASAATLERFVVDLRLDAARYHALDSPHANG